MCHPIILDAEQPYNRHILSLTPPPLQLPSVVTVAPTAWDRIAKYSRLISYLTRVLNNVHKNCLAGYFFLATVRSEIISR